MDQLFYQAAERRQARNPPGGVGKKQFNVAEAG
jgi:hypothetical protein